MKYKHIVFDVDGTLIDTKNSIIHSLQDVMLQETGRKLREEECYFCLGITGEETLRRLGITDIAGVMERWVAILNRYNGENQVFDGIEELVEHLHTRGYQLGVVTSRASAFYHEDMDTRTIAHCLKTHITADDTQEHKPLAAPLLKYMERTGAKPETVLYVGDSVYDSQCARNAGVDFALAGWGTVDLTIPGNFVADRPDRLEEWIENQ